VALINPNQYIKQFRDLGDYLADGITSLAGNMNFVYFHVIWFGSWILAGTGYFGPEFAFDKFPFGLLTMVVSLEAIFLSTFVLISQNRSAEKSEIRAQLDYETDIQVEKEVDLIMQTLVRIAKKQGVDVSDLVESMAETHQHAKREADRRTEARHKRFAKEKNGG
jgi:uncharacterized membrane protein